MNCLPFATSLPDENDSLGTEVPSALIWERNMDTASVLKMSEMQSVLKVTPMKKERAIIWKYPAETELAAAWWTDESANFGSTKTYHKILSWKLCPAILQCINFI